MKKIYLFVLIFWCLLISCSKMSTGEKGEQYYEKGDLKKAEEYFLKAVEESKDNKAMNYLGSLYAKQEKYELAEKYWKMAMETDGDGNKNIPIYNLGKMYENLNKYDLAEKYYKLAIDNNNKEADYNLGSLYRELKKYDLAEQYYKLAIENGNIASLNE